MSPSRRCRTFSAACHRAPRARARASATVSTLRSSTAPHGTPSPVRLASRGQRQVSASDAVRNGTGSLGHKGPEQGLACGACQIVSRSPRWLLKICTWLPHATRARNVGRLAQVSPGSPSSLSLSPYATRETAGAGAAAAGVAT